jgi:transcriptional regulator with XRE-family HTH domain
MLKEDIGKRIRDLRVTKTNLSQDDFAKKIGIDRTYLSRVESGKQNITIENLNLICNGLSITLHDFFVPFSEEIESEKQETDDNE